MREDVPPIAGPGSEVYAFLSGWAWCGACGYTGRVKGPQQAACGQGIWHSWLEQCVDMEPKSLLAPMIPSGASLDCA